jgi:predicted phosphodiesterase
MRILILSDVHANLNALTSVLQEAGKVDAVWCLGDLTGYGPDPNECIRLIRGLPGLVCLMGNHDAAVIGKIDLNSFNKEARLAAQWTHKVLDRENLAFLESLPEKQEIHGVTLAHGSPRNPIWEYLLDTYTAAINFTAFDTDYAFVGHTHIPLCYLMNAEDRMEWRIMKDKEEIEMNSRGILNPGSVGQPRDHDRRAAFAIFQPENALWTSHRVEYNFAPVQERIRARGLPKRHAQRLEEGW